MLQKDKHIFSFALLCFFLYPLIYQSIHVFEHTRDSHETHFCSHCNHTDGDYASHQSDPATREALSEKQNECAVCNFHYAKLQVNSSLNFYLKEHNYYSFHEQSYPKPFVLFQGYSCALRAPPVS